ncbi:MAG: hypothetical protein LKM39_10435 [Chiayiivirga sp.]|nr:hypothetical protein [Chiayiivirga sp.]
MGAGKPGDIAYLADIARPDMALVNNIASAHLERMGSCWAWPKPRVRSTTRCRPTASR